MKGNRLSGKSKADAGRMGKGENAYSAKEAKDWQATLRRIEAIAARATGTGLETVRDSRLALHLPVKAVRF